MQVTVRRPAGEVRVGDVYVREAQDVNPDLVSRSYHQVTDVERDGGSVVLGFEDFEVSLHADTEVAVRIDAVTTAQAAELADITPASFRSLAKRARAAGVELLTPEDTWLSARTPLYDAAAVKDYLESRPGSGRWGRREQA